MGRGNLSETNIQKGLDRGVATAGWISMFSEVKIQHLAHSFSDHCPLLINMRKDKERQSSVSFKFEAWWVLEDTFFEEVKRLWESSPRTLPMKLENLKKGLSLWVGIIRVKRKEKRQILTDKLTNLLTNDRDEGNLAYLIDTRIQLNFEIKKDEHYWE